MYALRKVSGSIPDLSNHFLFFLPTRNAARIQIFFEEENHRVPPHDTTTIQMSGSLISAVSWVKRGVALQNPSKYVLDDQELERVSALARIELEDAQVELKRAHNAAKSMGKSDLDGEDGDSEVDVEVMEGDRDGDEGDWVE